MELKAKIQADIDRHELMACHDLARAMSTINFAQLAERMVGENKDELAGYRVADGIATIDIRGLLVPTMNNDYSDWGITGYNHIAEYVQQANDDPTVQSIVLDIDSGGGYVAGMDVAIDAIKQSSLPVEAFASGSMYSAAYHIGSTAKTITATKTSGIGSIGVIAKHYEWSKAMEDEGVTATFIRSGKWKAVYGSDEPLTDEQKTRLKEDVDASASLFFEHVATARGIDAKTIKAWEGDCFNAQTAKDYGLIDSIASQSATQTNKIPSMSQEDNMDLQAAQAKITELETQLSAKDTEMKALQAAKRDDAITALAEKSGQTFTDEQITAFKAMDDSAFAITASFIPAKAEQNKQGLPEALFNEQALNGAQAKVDDLDANITKWAAGA